MADLKGFDELEAKLRAMVAAKVPEGTDLNCEVGYSAAYAVHVHEDLTAYHEEGEAKFLERPARELREDLFRIVVEAMARGRTVGQALLLAGLRLQRESQLLVPVDTGLLRSSAYTRLTKA